VDGLNKKKKSGVSEGIKKENKERSEREEIFAEKKKFSHSREKTCPAIVGL
jgi:hypothetical protein